MQKLNIRLSICLFVVLCANLSYAATQLQAQGRLSKVRNAVHRHHVPQNKKHKNHDDDEDQEHHGHRHHRPRRNRGHRHGAGGGGRFGFFLTNSFWNDCHHHCHPPQVVEHVHIYEPMPVQYVQPDVVEPVVVDAIPVDVYPLAPVERVANDPVFASYFSSWRGRISATFGSDFNDLSHGSLAALLQTPGWLGLDTRVTMFRESGMAFRDHLWLGDVNVVYEAINTDCFRARLGVGVNWLGDRYVGAAGANLTFGVDWQINPNWVVTGETDFGSLGDSDLLHARIGLGRQFGHAEWTTGYDYYDIGGVTLGGVFTGLQFRF